MDTELFELCKSVFEKTGWDDDKLLPKGIPAHLGYCPLYTSDYLLEKLPKRIEKAGGVYWITISPMDRQGTWGVSYESNPDEENMLFNFADTPLKALLKLTIELAEDKLL